VADEYQVLGWLFTAKDEASPVLETGQAAIERSAGKIDKALGGLVENVDESTATLSSTLGDFAENTLDLILKPLDLIESAFVNVGKAVIGIPVNIVRQLGIGIQSLGQTASSAAVRVGEIVQDFISLDTLKKGLVASGGLFGALLGPFGSLLKLFSPLIDVLVEGLSPAMETFAAIFKTSFKDLFALAEVMAQMFAPMIQKFIAPFVSLMEVMAVHVASFVAGLLKSTSASSGIASLFQSLGPVIMDIFRALGGLGSELLPVVVKTFSELAPVAGEIIKTIGKLAAELLPEFGRIAAEVIPPLAKAFVGLLKAIMPLVPPLAKLATVLVKDVFGPATVAGIKMLADWIEKSVIPFIKEWMPALIIVVKDVAKQVSDFYGNFTKNITDFYTAVLKPSLIDPVVKAWKDFKGGLANGVREVMKFKDTLMEFSKGVLSLFGVGEVKASTINLVQAFIAPLQMTIDSMKATINDYLVKTANAILAWDPPGPGDSVANMMGLGKAFQIPQLAEGGIITPSTGGTLVNVGEGKHAETVIPLTAEKVREFIGPLDLKVEGGREVVSLMRSIHEALKGTLRVDPGKAAAMAVGGRDDFAGFGSVGFSGVIG